MFSFTDLKSVHIEISNRCQAQCPMCSRNHHGGIENPLLREADWTVNDFIQVFDQEVKRQIEKITFCGNFGDPLLNFHLVKMLDWVKDDDIYIDIHTNGSLRNERWWKDLPKHLPAEHKVVFAIDGLADTNPLYRINTNFDKIIENARAFIDAGGYAKWKFLIFDHNKHQVDQARELSKSMGFKQFITTTGKRFTNSQQNVENKLYKNKASLVKDTVKENGFSLAPAIEVDEKLQRTIEYRTKIFKDPNSISDDVEINCRTKDEKYLFVDQFGKLWPCCFWSSQHEKNWPGLANWDYWWDKFQTSYGHNFNQLSSSNTILDMLDHDLLSNWLPQSFSGEHKKCDVCVHNCKKGVSSKNVLQSS